MQDKVSLEMLHKIRVKILKGFECSLVEGSKGKERLAWF